MNQAQIQLLATAIELEGSKEAVAAALRVPEGTFERWLTGQAMMPRRAMALASDLIARHEGASPG